jgi:hypothetical protein
MLSHAPRISAAGHLLYLFDFDLDLDVRKKQSLSWEKCASGAGQGPIGRAQPSRGSEPFILYYNHKEADKTYSGEIGGRWEIHAAGQLFPWRRVNQKLPYQGCRNQYSKNSSPAFFSCSFWEAVGNQDNNTGAPQIGRKHV